MGKIKVIVKRPDEKVGHIEEIENELESFQDIVEGYIEEVFLSSSLVFICNEEGKINGLPYNRDIGHDIIAGNFIIISSDVENGEDKSLSDKQIEKYKKIFNDKSIEDTNIKITNIILENNGFEI